MLPRRATWGALAVVTACSFRPTEDVGAGRAGDASIFDESDAAVVASDANPTPDATDGPATDGAATDAAPGTACPAGYATVHGGRYALRHVAQLHGIAMADCGDDLFGRTHLATFEMAGDLDAVIAQLDPGNSATVFVGASCLPLSPTACAAPGGWTWVGGAVVASMLWQPGQPDNPLTETVALVQRESGTWRLNNVSSLSTRPYVCECDP